MIDYTINLGNILQILVIVVGGFGALAALRSTVRNLQTDMVNVQKELQKLGEVIVKMAVADTRLNNLDRRVDGIENDVRELKHGEGFVFPLLRGKQQP